MLAKAQKTIKIQQVKTVDSLLNTRSRAIVRALDTIETYQDSATQSLLDLPRLENEDEHEN